MAEETLADPGTKTVLIVDDDDSIQDFLSMIVTREGFKVKQAKNGVDAVKSASSETPDLILLDLMLPGKGGYEVVRELQATDAARTPVIMITGRDINSRNLDMLKQEPNVRDLLQKPVHAALLAASLHSLLKTQPPGISRKGGGPMSGQSL